jgi:hypothetical protein
MERDPHESLEEQLEPILKDALEDDITPASFAGVISTLEGWKTTYQEDETPERLAQRRAYLREWSEQASVFFMDLPRTNWMCFLEVGDTPIVGHELRPLDNAYALFDKLLLPPHSAYDVNFADMMNVPADSEAEDLPSERHSSLKQLYIGDTHKRVAISFNQFADSLLNNGSISLRPKAAFPPASYR